VVGAVPYIALQLRAVAASLQVFLRTTVKSAIEVEFWALAIRTTRATSR
jgi:Na+/proline symporter